MNRHFSNEESLKGTGNAPRTSLGENVRKAGHKLDDLGEKAGDATDELVKKTVEMATDLKKSAAQYTDQVTNYITHNPVKSALIAGGVGLLIGLFLKK